MKTTYYYNLNKILSKFLQISIPLGLGIFLIGYTYSKFTLAQLDEIAQYFKNANYWIVGLSVMLSVLSHLSRAYRWSFMLEPLGFKPKIANNFMAISIAYLLNIFIPKSGEVSRGILLDRYEKVPFSSGFGTIITERVVDLIFLLGFTIIALFLKFDILFNYIKDAIPPSVLYILLGGLFFLGLLLLLFLKYSETKLNSKIKHFIKGLKNGMLSVIKMKKKRAFLLHSFFIWGLYILSFYTATQALIQTEEIGFGTIIIAFVVGSFTFAFTNSGFGTYPAAIAGILVLFSVSFTVGTAFGWIVWISNITSIIVIGIVSMIALPIYNKKSRTKE